MTTTSQWATVVDAVLVAVRAAPALAKVTIYDGPPVSGSVPTDVLCIGHVLDDADDLSGNTRQQWHDTGTNAARDETLTIRCCARAVSGDTDLAPVRARAFTILAAVEAALRADIDLTVAAAEWVEMEAGDVRQVQAAAGCGCQVEFTITAHCLI